MIIKKNSISVHCSYFGDNYGDTLFVVEMLKFLESTGVDAQDVCLPFASERVVSQVGLVKKGFVNFLRSEKVIFAGGGYFGEPSKGKLFWNLRFLLRHGVVILGSLLLNKKVIVTGVGVGPISSSINRFLIRSLFNRATRVLVRDKDSLAFSVNTLGVKKCELSSDPIISSAINTKFITQNKDIKNVGIHLPMLVDSVALQTMAKELKHLQDKYNFQYVVFLDFYKPNFNNLIEKHLVQLNVRYTNFQYDGVKSLSTTLGNFDFVITTKLHVGIVTTSYGIPAFSLYVHTKTPKYYNLIKKGNWCKAFYDFEEGDFERFINSIKNDIVVNIPKDVINSSKDNYLVIKDWL